MAFVVDGQNSFISETYADSNPTVSSDNKIGIFSIDAL